MLLVFYLTFEVIGAFLSDLLAMGINALAGVTDAALTAYGINPVVHSLVIDGLFGGVGNVVSFLPIIVVLFFFLSMLEDTGYMARVAFVMDKLLRRIGLPEKRCADAHRLWLHCSGGHGNADAHERSRPPYDRASHAVYELQRQDPHLFRLRCGVFPEV